MSKVFVSIALSLDGYMAPRGMTMEHWDDPDHESWGALGGADGVDRRAAAFSRAAQAGFGRADRPGERQAPAHDAAHRREHHGQAGAPMSSSLATTELVATGATTLLRFTEHTAFVDGIDASAGRREGSLGLLEALANELAMHG